MKITGIFTTGMVVCLVLSSLRPSIARADDDAERPAKSQQRLIDVDGEPGIKLDAQTIKRNGIEVAVLPVVPWQRQLRGYGMVLDPARLADVANEITVARAQTQMAEVRLAASKTAFERAGALYRGQQNISLAQMQSAEAAYHTDQASLAAANSQARTLAMTASLNFGSALGTAVEDNTGLAQQLLSRQSFLLQVSMPPGPAPQVPPPTATVQDASGRVITIAFLSMASTVDPRIQGLSYLYLLPTSDSILPGMNVLVSLPTGPAIDGVTIPNSAIIWWQDRAWVYRQVNPDVFVRTQIATDLASGEGGYIARGLARTPIVTRGAQLLLSEEFRSQIQSDDD